MRAVRCGPGDHDELVAQVGGEIEIRAKHLARPLAHVGAMLRFELVAIS